MNLLSFLVVFAMSVAVTSYLLYSDNFVEYSGDPFGAFLNGSASLGWSAMICFGVTEIFRRLNLFYLSNDVAGLALTIALGETLTALAFYYWPRLQRFTSR